MQEHMAGRGREKASGVSFPHHPSRERSVFIGKDEAYIINRKKKEKSMLRKGGECIRA